jgi:glycine/D-amino acid oxidase-like deaminating enzyme
MANALASQYERVVVLDRRAPVHGSTAASTAMLQFEIDEPLTMLGRRIGMEKAGRAWRRSLRATHDLVDLVTHQGIRCGLEPRDALYLTGGDIGARGLKWESEARDRAGIPGDFLDKTALRSRFGIDRTGAILSPDCAVANPVQLAAGLLRRAGTRGAKIFSPVNVTGVNATPREVTLDAGRYAITAKFVVFCTGYEVLRGLPVRGATISSTWAIASRPHAKYPRWLDRTIVWEASTPYLYLRTTPDGRLIAGGEDEDIDQPNYRVRNIERKAAELASKAQVLIPGLEFRPSRKWTGAFGESVDGLPFIDAVPGMPRCFVVMGFGGNGTVYSMIASQIVPALLKRRKHVDGDLYRFGHR